MCFGYGVHTSKVEICAGDGQFSRAFWSVGFKGKAMDVPWLISFIYITMLLNFP